jgi:WD40 repeat protein
MLCLVTYDGHLVVWDVRPTSAGAFTASLEVALTSHQGSVPSLACWSDDRSRTLATGGSDEAVRVFDLRTRRVVGTLLQHNGTVSALAFVAPGRTLLSGGDDGAIIVWRCSDWGSLLVMKGHKGRVEAIAPHPSGRVALSLGRDATLRLWDLTKGRQAHAQPVRAGGRAAAWSTDGARFFVLFDACVSVHAGSDGAEIAVLTPPKGRGCGALSSTPRLHGMALLPLAGGGEALVVGAEGGDVLLWDAASAGDEAAPCLVLATGHEPRVRAVAVMRLKSGGGGAPAAAPPPPAGLAKLSAEAVSFELRAHTGDCCALVTVGSDGVALLWDGRALGAQFAAAKPGVKMARVADGKARVGGGGGSGGGGGGDSCGVGQGAMFIITGLSPVAALRAAHNTRPTGAVGVDAL